MKLVRVFESAALGYGPEKRVILLHGPVGRPSPPGSSEGLEWYSRQRGRPPFWVGDDGGATASPLNEPSQAHHLDIRPQFCCSPSSEDALATLKVAGELDPVSRFLYRETLKQVNGDWRKLTQRIRVRRLVLSEKDRVGIGTFQPKDEKNQDSTELTGDINYRKIAEYGSDSDPRAFNFDGEFCVANRGIIEFVEVLGLDVAFLPARRQSGA